MVKQFSIYICILFAASIALGQGFINEVNVATSASIGKGSSADTKSVLDMVSTTKGLLIPRMTTAQRDAISSPPTGLIIWNTTTTALNHYNGAAWKQFASDGLTFTGTASLATAGAANGANCSAGSFPLGVDTSWAAESCTALPTTIAGTANQITASAATGAITLSIPSSPTLPGTTTGTFSGNITGNATGNVTGNLTGNITGASQVTGTTGLTWNGSGTSGGLFTIGTAGTSGGSLFINTASLSSSFASGFGFDDSYSSQISTNKMHSYGVFSGGGYGSRLEFYTTLGTTETRGLLIDENQAATFANTVTATTFVGAFNGTSTNATNTAITDDTTTNATMYPTWVTTTTGNLPQKVSSSKLTFNPSTGALTSSSYAGNTAASTITGTTLASNVVTSSLTTVGTIATGVWSGTAVAANKGGTGLTSGTSGGVPYFSGTTTIASSGALAQNGVVLGGGAGATPTTLATDSSTAKVLISGGTNVAPSWGTVAIGGGGTGQTTKAAGFDALQPMTTSGDVIYGGTSGTGTRLAKGTDGNVLTLASGLPSWAAPGALAQDEIHLSTPGAGAAGHGSSTGTKIRRFTVTSLDTASGMTYADSSTAGMTITIASAGTYCISYSDMSSSQWNFGVSVNASSLTTAIDGTTYANGLRFYSHGGVANFYQNVSGCVYLAASDVVRAHDDGGPTATDARAYFHIVRVN